MNEWLNKRTFTNFLLSIRAQLIVFAGTNALFLLVYVLARFPLSLLLYSMQIAFFVYLIYLLVQYMHYVRRFTAISRLQDASYSRSEEMPASGDPADRLYEETLQSLVAERRELQKRQAVKEAEQLDYFTLWIHQIKTPIAAIGLLTQQLTHHEKEAKQLAQELRRLEDYSDMALNYLKLESSGGELDLADVELDDIIKQAVRKYSIFFIYNNIKLEYQPLKTTVLSDGRWLQVLIEQILSNSLKYTKTGTISIYMDPAHHQALVIEDTGVGIRPEDLPKVFNKGYSGLNGRLHEKSSGLGLFLGKTICRRLGHDITIESEPDRGTKVRITFTRDKLIQFS